MIYYSAIGSNRNWKALRKIIECPCSIPSSHVGAKSSRNQSAKEIFSKVCLSFEAELAEFEEEGDHVHFLVNFSPKAQISKFLNKLEITAEIPPQERSAHRVPFVLVLGEEVIPLSAVAHYSHGYCEENSFTYKSLSKNPGNSKCC